MDGRARPRLFEASPTRPPFVGGPGHADGACVALNAVYAVHFETYGTLAVDRLRSSSPRRGRPPPAHARRDADPASATDRLPRTRPRPCRRTRRRRAGRGAGLGSRACRVPGRAAGRHGPRVLPCGSPCGARCGRQAGRRVLAVRRQLGERRVVQWAVGVGRTRGVTRPCAGAVTRPAPAAIRFPADRQRFVGRGRSAGVRGGGNGRVAGGEARWSPFVTVLAAFVLAADLTTVRTGGGGRCSPSRPWRSE